MTSKFSTSSSPAAAGATDTTYLASEESQRAQRAREASNKELPDVGLKWGRTPNDRTTSAADTSTNDRPDWENFYSEEEKAKLRAKGINPALKAEMEHSRKKSKESGFWGKVAGTAFGGGVIK